MIPKGTVCRVKADTDYVKAGVRVVVNEDNRTPIYLDLNGGYVCCVTEDNLEPLSGLEAIKTGDVLVNRNGDERTVLGCCGEAVHLSTWNDASRYDATWTRAQLAANGYHPKSAPAAKRPGYAYDDKGNEIGQVIDGKIIR